MPSHSKVEPPRHLQPKACHLPPFKYLISNYPTETPPIGRTGFAYTRPERFTYTPLPATSLLFTTVRARHLHPTFSTSERLPLSSTARDGGRVAAVTPPTPNHQPQGGDGATTHGHGLSHPAPWDPQTGPALSSQMCRAEGQKTIASSRNTLKHGL